MSISETARRQLIVARFLGSALSGDVPGFLANLIEVDWSGAWPEIFRRVVEAGYVHPAVRTAFRDAWRGSESQTTGPANLGERMGWSLTEAFDGQLDMMIAGLRLLMPASLARWPVYALYRGQGVAEHEAGRHGVWWTPDPVYAELYARMPSRTRTGPGAVVVAFVPQNAIITALCPTEFLVDPRRLEDVVLVAELPGYAGEDIEDLFRASRLLGIPSGYCAEDLDRWLADGRLIEGLVTCRQEREQHGLAA